MATICVDVECRPYFRGEVVPIIVEVKSETDDEFIVLNNPRTYCEVLGAGDEMMEKLSVRVKSISETVKQLYCAWDTTKIDPGYYSLRFWVSISMFGIEDARGNINEDFRICSDYLKRFIKDI